MCNPSARCCFVVLQASVRPTAATSVRPTSRARRSHSAAAAAKSRPRSSTALPFFSGPAQLCGAPSTRQGGSGGFRLQGGDTGRRAPTGEAARDRDDGNGARQRRSSVVQLRAPCASARQRRHFACRRLLARHWLLLSALALPTQLPHSLVPVVSPPCPRQAYAWRCKV